MLRFQLGVVIQGEDFAKAASLMHALHGFVLEKLSCMNKDSDFDPKRRQMAGGGWRSRRLGVAPEKIRGEWEVEGEQGGDKPKRKTGHAWRRESVVHVHFSLLCVYTLCLPLRLQVQ